MTFCILLYFYQSIDWEVGNFIMNTEEAIHNSAVQLFAEKGFEATSIRDIARVAGINSATLYHYIKSKDELLINVMVKDLNKLLNVAIKVVNQFNDPGEKLCALSYLHVKLHASNQLSMIVTDHEYKSLYGEHKEKIKSLRKQYETLWLDTVQQGIDESKFGLVENVKLNTFALLSMNTGVVHWFKPNGKLSISEISETYAKSSLHLVGLKFQNMQHVFGVVEKETEQ